MHNSVSSPAVAETIPVIAAPAHGGWPGWVDVSDQLNTKRTINPV